MNTSIDFIGYGVLAWNLAIIVGWPILALLTLLALRRRHLTGPTLAIWALIIVAVPFLGPLAYWLMRPEQPAAEAPRHNPAPSDQ